MSNGERRLQVIMFTDVKGYSAMMGADEAHTIRLVQEHRAIVREILAQHQGHEQRTIGDGFLLLFESAVDAVRCAVAIQERMVERNRGRPPTEQIWLRIGIHAGDVVHEADGEIAGDAVNVAARVEPLAPVGGICLTDVVAAVARGHLDRPLVAMPPVALKNIARPPALFTIAIAPAEPVRRVVPWGWLAVGAAAALLVATLAFGVWWLRPEPGPWPIASADPVAQQKYEVAMAAFVRMDREAEALAREALAADPTNAHAAALIIATQPMGPAEEARQQALKVVEGRDDPAARLVRLVDASIRHLVGGVGVHVGSDLVTEWDAWIRDNPDDVEGAFLRAKFYPIHGNETDFHKEDPGREHLTAILMREFVAQHPDWTVARVALIDMQALSHDAEVPEIVAEGIRRCPSCAALHWIHGFWLYRHDRDAEARGELLTALELDPALNEARSLLANLALRAGDEAERVRLVTAGLAPELPASDRANFAWMHGGELFFQGRFTDGSDLYHRGFQLAAEAGDHDLVPERLSELATVSSEGLEGARAARAVAELESYLARPELGDTARRVGALRALELRSSQALLDRDLVAAQEVLAAILAIPEGRLEEAQLDPARRSAELAVRTLAGQPVDVADLDRLNSCGTTLRDADLYRAARDPRVEPTLRELLASGLCKPERLLDVRLHVELAELTTDPAERAALLAEVRKLWPQADPDLVLMRRVAALEP